MKKSFYRHHRDTILLASSIAAAIIASIYFVVTPDVDTRVATWQKYALLYAHSFCWALISLACLGLRAKASKTLVNCLIYGAVAVYGLFILVLIIQP